MEGGKVESVSEFRIRKLLERTLDTALADRAQGTITRTQYRVSYPKLNGNGLAAFTIVYDTQADAFIPDEGYAVAAYCYLDGEADANELLASEADNFSLLYELESGNADWDPTGAAETAIQRIFRTKDLSLGAGPSLWKQHRFLELEAATTDATITIYAHLDRDATTIQVRVVSLEEEGGLWDDATWDEFDWAAEGLKQISLSLPQALLARRIAFTVEQNAIEPPFLIERMSIGGSVKQQRAKE
jgi:hypothetical protein